MLVTAAAFKNGFKVQVPLKLKKKELSFIDCSGSSDTDSSTQSDVESGPAPATKVVSLPARASEPHTGCSIEISRDIVYGYNVGMSRMSN